MFYQTSMGLIYLIFNQLPFLWDTSEGINVIMNINLQIQIIITKFAL